LITSVAVRYACFSPIGFHNIFANIAPYMFVKRATAIAGPTA